MLVSLFTSISGLKSHTQLLSVVSNNLANVNTSGFKGSRTEFQDQLSQTLVAPTTATSVQAGRNGVQIGLGVGVGSVTPIFTQGSLASTGVPTDVALEGSGFFVVRDPANGNTFYTRAGKLSVDINNFLVDSNGLRVQGFQVPDQSAPTVPAAGDPIGDITIAPDASQTAPLVDFTIEASGRILLQLDNGNIVPAAHISLNDFTNKEGLLKVGRNLFQETPAAGIKFTGYQPPGVAGTAQLRAGFLELSNVDVAQEFTDMIRSQRGLQANSRVITTSDEVLQELINLKR